MKRQPNMPSLVYWSLWGINSRKLCQLCMAIALIVGIAGLLLGEFIAGIAMFIAAYAYYYAMQWVDTHGSWEKSR
jgi:hypothetical protein